MNKTANKTDSRILLIFKKQTARARDSGGDDGGGKRLQICNCIYGNGKVTAANGNCR
ncbi:hypothetical protein MmiAt1_10920 [Methanimicrococcus sp. At1]|uniref:Uncharacterized protein n=1 Tax=Methanimicrococcus hacksteinii TaxID=3028293 RepID=A0ABU3VQC6_9EURY|nr:hypothetical protein [Methanimicrococcus sp. At1]MDV0445509.1 hypothetical protein [Methanimicrococcus sp. At1]